MLITRIPLWDAILYTWNILDHWPLAIDRRIKMCFSRMNDWEGWFQQIEDALYANRFLTAFSAIDAYARETHHVNATYFAQKNHQCYEISSTSKARHCIDLAADVLEVIWTWITLLNGVESQLGLSHMARVNSAALDNSMHDIVIIVRYTCAFTDTIKCVCIEELRTIPLNQ